MSGRWVGRPIRQLAWLPNGGASLAGDHPWRPSARLAPLCSFPAGYYAGGSANHRSMGVHKPSSPPGEPNPPS